MKKIFIAALLSCGLLAVNAQSFIKTPATPVLQLEALGASDNHVYVCGLNVATMKPFVWNTETRQVVESVEEFTNADFRSVTNDGRAFGIIGLEDLVTTNAAMMDTEGKVTIIESSMSVLYDVTPDGSIAVGALLDDMWLPTPCIWKDGERIELSCPTSEECGFETDGVCPQFISADGNVIAGYIQDNLSSRPAIIWTKQEDGTYKHNVICKGLWEGHYGDGLEYMEFNCCGISENGKWLCLAVRHEGEEFKPTEEHMVRMNLETNEIEESENGDYFYEGDGCFPTSIANDGTVVGVKVDLMRFTMGVLWRVGEKTPVLLADVFPQFSDIAEYDCFLNYPLTITSDGEYISGYGCPVNVDETGSDYDFVAYQLSFHGTDGIEMVKAENHSPLTYNLQGQRVSAAAKGLLISGGRKVIR